MNRILTRRERSAIADALFEQAKTFDLRAEAVLARKREVEPISDGDEHTSTEDKLDDAVRRRAAALTKHANRLATLAHFVSHNETTVACLITIPEQF